MTPDELARIRDNIDRGAGDGAIDRERLMAHIDGVPECPEVNGTTGRRCLRGTGHVGAHVNEFEQWRECYFPACYLPDGHKGEHYETDVPVKSPVDPGRVERVEALAAELFGHTPSRNSWKGYDRYKLAGMLDDLGYRPTQPIDDLVDCGLYVHNTQVYVRYVLDFTPRVARMVFSGMSGAHLQHVNAIPKDAKYLGKLGFDL